MRYDLDGFFWQDEEVINDTVVRPMATIPDTGWAPPKEFPNLFNEKIIGLDLETYDPELMTCGPGWSRGVGNIIGVSLATADASWYFPVGHTVQSEDNMDKEAVFKYLRDLLGRPMDKVGANILYDIGWLAHEGINTAGLCYDIQYAEALLYDTARSYSLDTIAKKYLGEGKVSEQLYKWCQRSYGGKLNGSQRSNMYRTPPCLAGPYAEADASQPLHILKAQYIDLKEAGLWDLFVMECKLINVLLGMRLRGLPVNVERAEEVEKELELKQNTAQDKLNEMAGFDVAVNANSDLRDLFDKFKIKYPYTAKGNPSFTAKFLTTNDSEPAKAVNNIRKLWKARVTFVRNGILDKQVGGKVYPSFHPLRGEQGGAGSGRYSSSMPNAQQIPARDKILAPLIRSLFVPETGYTNWIKLDYSQIEYRIFAHFSDDQKLINEYQDPDTDYHHIVSGFLDHLLIRGIVKNFNFMSLFGGGRAKTIGMIGEVLTPEQVNDMCIKFSLKHKTPASALNNLGGYFVDLYAEKFPAAKKTLHKFSKVAQESGEIRTLLNRRTTFDLWESADQRGKQPLPLEQALAKYGDNIVRGTTYRGLNRVTQGGSADILKKGILTAYEEGLFNSDRLGFPHVTVHDELDFSYNDELKQDFLKLKEIMETSIKLKVPVIVDAELGSNWGNVEEFNLGQ